MINLTQENFAEQLYAADPTKLTMVQFTANWCSSCQEFQQSTLKQLEELYPNKSVTFMKVDVDQAPDLADKYSVDKLPTFIFFKNRNMINFIVGNETLNKFKRVINDALNS